MYVNNFTLPRPKDELLAQCTLVTLDGDSLRDGEGRYSMRAMRKWCFDNCKSYVWSERIDMSDISSWTGPDDVIKFYFYEPDDAIWFKLRWS